MVGLDVAPNPGVAATKPKVLEVLRAGLDAWLATHQPTPEQARLVRDLRRCRTAALGGHLYVCPACTYELPVYNPCGNRHCPNCQALHQERWIAARAAVLLPVGHHHVVFTLPSQLRPLVRSAPREMYQLLFEASAETLATLATDTLEATLGVTAVLHTWRRDLGFHPHLHCIVSGGGLRTDDTQWVARQQFLFPVRRMKARFRSKVLARLHQLRQRGAWSMLLDAEWRRVLRSLPSQRKWVVYLDAPFGRSTHVLEYLGRYTHRVAISDARLIAAEAQSVSFSTRQGQVAQLPLAQFVDRFFQHVLPSAFHKIRHFGLYAPGHTRRRLDVARALLGQGDQAAREAPSPEAAPSPLAPPGDPEPRSEPRSPGDALSCPLCGHQGLLYYILPPVNPPRRLWRPP